MAPDHDVQTALLETDRQLERMNQYNALHKAGFRIAFDFLNAGFPPASSDEYWDMLAKLAQKRADDNPDNRLIRHLLPAIIDYLSEVAVGAESSSTTSGKE